LRDVSQLRDLLIGRLDVEVAAKHPIDFLIGLLENVRMLQQRIDRARQHSAGGFVPGDQERVDLVCVASGLLSNDLISLYVKSLASKVEKAGEV
jgi:hypothetical protein